VGPGVGQDQAYAFMTVTIRFPAQQPPSARSLPLDSPLSQNIINWTVARQWRQPPIVSRRSTTELPTGNWIKILVTEDGPVRLTGQQIMDLSPFDVTQNPRSFSVFTGPQGGRPYDQSPNQALPENLVEVPMMVIGENNGQLDADDKLLWYGRGAQGFEINGTQVVYRQNVYFTENVYWLLIPNDDQRTGLRITEISTSDLGAETVNSVSAYLHSEFDLLNPYESGLLWVQNAISPGGSQNIPFTLQNPINDPLLATSLTVQMYGGSSSGNSIFANHSIAVAINGNTLSGNLFWAGFGKKTMTFSLNFANLISGNNTLKLTNVSNDPNSEPYYDAFTLHYFRSLEFNGQSFDFYSPENGAKYRYVFSGVEPQQVWDITNPDHSVSLTIQPESTGWSVIDDVPGDSLHRLIVFNPEYIPLPTELTWVGPKSFQEFRTTQRYAEHIIIGPKEFQNAAQPLVDFRDQSMYVPIETLYDEFTAGCKDPMAIRFFIQWARENWTNLPPLRPMIFLLGDADFDYRNITGESRTLVPTIEIGLTSSRATDDRLATVYGDIPEVPLGRYPAHTVEDVTNYIEKVLELENHPISGLWRQQITLVADDTKRPEHLISQISTGKSHTINSEILSALVDPSVITKKLYMIEYPEVSDASSYGVIKPDATQALLDQIREGTAIINYIGHGSEHQWAQERLLFQDRGDVNAIQTGMKLPLWIAGTCSWGHFDYVQNEAFSEDLIRKPMDGAAAIITTSRLITVTSNQYYTEQIFRSIFPNRQVSHHPLGDILQSVKTGNADGELFHLFGDPALKLPLAADTLSALTLSQDTLKALEQAEFFGTQNLLAGTGTGIVNLRDADRYITRTYSFLNTEQSLSFTLPGPTLFRGQIGFTGSNFSGLVRIPLDISYSNNPGYLSVYISGDETPFQDAMGSIGGLFFTGGDPTTDHTGPQIYFETESGRRLGNGDHLFGEENLVVRLSDPLGVNVTGEIGHSIQVSYEDGGDLQDVTDRFIYDMNSITTGTLTILNQEIQDGGILHVEAWDNANNRSQSELKIFKSAFSGLKLMNVYNYPNPFQLRTDFTFELSEQAEVTIDIFTLKGRKIASLGPQLMEAGFNALSWAGRDAYGQSLANGVYLYRIKARNSSGSVHRIERLAKYE